MLVAGEEIDSQLGVRFGLSMLASAGLGNMVADVVGVGAANAIEVRSLHPYEMLFLHSPHIFYTIPYFGIAAAL